MAPIKSIFQERAAFSEDRTAAQENPLDSSDDDMMQDTRGVNAGLAGYAFQTPASCSLVNKETTSPFQSLWERGDYRGGEIGRVFGLGEPWVSRRAIMAKDKLEKDRKFRARFEKIKSPINV